MPEQLFDQAAEYEAMLNQGIGLSGERLEFFIAGRVQDMRSQIPPAPSRILDFGCGTGKATAYLSQVFSAAEVVGADVSHGALEHAKTHFASDRVTFVSIPELPNFDRFDLCYINGVFHHIMPEERQQTLVMIRNLLKPGAHLALFENNPWNPGARIVMRRIPFDRDAIPLSYLETRRTVRAAGFQVYATRFLFYLPKSLSLLRFIEPLLVNVPFGGPVLCTSCDPSICLTPSCMAEDDAE